jgi:transcriptional regulator with XRE-family HTH domain
VTAIGEFIRQERIARDMTQRELAWRLTTSVVNVRAWELGYRAPGRNNVDKVFRWLTERPRVPQSVVTLALDSARIAHIKKVASQQEQAT